MRAAIPTLWKARTSAQQLGQSLRTLLHSVGADHLTDGGDAVALEEHMLGAAQADALSTQLTGLGGVVGGVGIGTDLQAAELIGPAHDAAEVAADAGVHGTHAAEGYSLTFSADCFRY